VSSTFVCPRCGKTLFHRNPIHTCNRTKYACTECGSKENLVGPPFLCGKCFAARDENGQLRTKEPAA